jgi:hypothetical protein
MLSGPGAKPTQSTNGLHPGQGDFRLSSPQNRAPNRKEFRIRGKPATCRFRRSCYNQRMNLLTLHELSLHLDVSVRVLRHRLRQLLLEGKLIENRDCRRDGYVDATHSVWRVDPVAFVRASRIPSASRPDNRATTETLTLATKPGSHPSQPVVSPSNSNSQTLPNVDKPSSALEREMIDLLKGQLKGAMNRRYPVSFIGFVKALTMRKIAFACQTE